MLQESKLNNSFADSPLRRGTIDARMMDPRSSAEEFRELLQQHHLQELAEFMIKLGQPAGKKSFLVYKNNKYVNITTDNIAYFYVRYDTTILVTFDKQEYFINHSLEEIQHLVPSSHFFRVNRQYLTSFSAIKEVEHYFARKLLVNLVIPTREKLLISKSKAAGFLHWLDNR